MRPRAGLESLALDRMPELLLAVTVPAAICGLSYSTDISRILALALIVAWWFMLIPLALACLTIVVMKSLWTSAPGRKRTSWQSDL
ncbi:MAG: hypothetical protein JO035_11780 [Betaproteobacteria bacterium]|nr:hypothetical protein [Betaproteobacteria bacterium]